MIKGRKFPKNSDGTSYTRWCVVPRHTLTAEMFYDLWAYPCGKEIHSSYDCTGQWFASSVKIRVTKTRILMTQFWGQDV